MSNSKLITMAPVVKEALRTMHEGLFQLEEVAEYEMMNLTLAQHDLDRLSDQEYGMIEFNLSAYNDHMTSIRTEMDALHMMIVKEIKRLEQPEDEDNEA